MPATPITHASVQVLGSYFFLGKRYKFTRSVTTNGSGNWTLSVTTAMTKTRLQWSASYAGDSTHSPATSNPLVLHVQPIITLGSGLKWNGSTYKIKAHKAFKLNATVKPAIQKPEAGGAVQAEGHQDVALDHTQGHGGRLGEGRDRAGLQQPGEVLAAVRVHRIGIGSVDDGVLARPALHRQLSPDITRDAAATGCGIANPVRRGARHR